jgi:hypothetical protein
VDRDARGHAEAEPTTGAADAGDIGIGVGSERALVGGHGGCVVRKNGALLFCCSARWLAYLQTHDQTHIIEGGWGRELYIDK